MIDDDISESHLTVGRDNRTRSDDKEMGENNRKRYVTIEMEFERDNDESDNNYSGAIIHIAKQLLKA